MSCPTTGCDANKVSEKPPRRIIRGEKGQNTQQFIICKSVIDGVVCNQMNSITSTTHICQKCGNKLLTYKMTDFNSGKPPKVYEE